jgi:hypothetical protein
MTKSPSSARRHMIIPDTQIRPGVPLDHIKWAAQAIVDYKPDVIVVIGDWWDMPSCSKHNLPGSKETEGARFKADIEIGNEAFRTLVAPMEAEQARRKYKKWNPRKVFTFGNHEFRVDRAVSETPKLEGMLTRDDMLTPGFERHEFLEIVPIDGIWYSHYFSNTLSGRPVGGTIPNRLNKIGTSFVQGHQQGFLYGCQQYPGKLVRHGLVAGSFYLHDEVYRDVQSNGEWRGIVVLNEVRGDGTYDIMPLSMDYLRRRYS